MNAWRAFVILLSHAQIPLLEVILVVLALMASMELQWVLMGVKVYLLSI